MPILILRDRCDDLPRCYAVAACPNQALMYDEAAGQVVVLAERCGDCRGPCLNFCDRYALKYASSLEELRLLQAELDGSLSGEEIAQERLRLKQAEEARRKQQQIPEATAANFQQQVLQARLPVLLFVDTLQSAASKQLTPTLEQIAQEYVGRLMIRRVNSDAEPQLVAALRVRTVPTLILLYQARLLDAVEGAVSPAQLRGWVQAAMEQLQSVAAAQDEPSDWPQDPGDSKHLGSKYSSRDGAVG